MTKSIGILYVHGIHVRKPGFSEKLHKRVMSYLRNECAGVPYPVVSQEVYWADVFRPLAGQLDTDGDAMATGWQWLRDQVLTTVAQAAGYEDDQGLGMHEVIHGRVAESLRILEAATDPLTPVIIVAHSLGSIIMSDYIWNKQNPDGKPRVVRGGVMERLVNLRGLVTMGSPLSLYASRWPAFGAPINMAGEPHRAPWVNLMAKRDVLAWPLKTLNDRYHQEVTEDVVLNTTWNWRTWSPLAHISYWTSDRAAATIGDMVKATWETM